eukprot:gb/GFBE01004570.1/.p1 GENE.gb/GFBE01004570.1/~~gb/GFBE01004570.1/.p1  ORF type:complete len:211 (+),score=38.96 gb/GFBE01004570.1/:1-633(+)
MALSLHPRGSTKTRHVQRSCAAQRLIRVVALAVLCCGCWFSSAASAYANPAATSGRETSPARLPPLPRRAAALAGAQLLVPGAAGPAGAKQIGSRDRNPLILYKRRKCLPKIFKGYEALKSQGAVTDEFLETELKPMVSAMREFGDVNRAGEAPDTMSKRLMQDADDFKQLALDKSYDKAMTMLEKYRNDVPFGMGVFEWDDDPSAALAY